MAKYVFDSNIFINLQRRQPIDLYPLVWNKIDELMKNGTVVSSREVLEEIVIGGDDLCKWTKDKKDLFLISDVTIQTEVRSILQSHRQLVEMGKKKNSADPFVIAVAKLHNCKVVTEETRTRNINSPKIPDICDIYGISCIDFVGFLREEKLQF